MNPCVRTALVLLLVAHPAAAEPVTHQFAGTVTSYGGALDLSSVFPLGQAVTVDCTVERATTPEPQDAYVTAYTNPVTMLAFSIGSWSGSGTPPISNATVTNNAPSPAPPSVVYDQWSWNEQGLVAPAIGTIQLQSMTSTLDDIDGTVFDSQAIPRVMPALGAFEGKTATFLFIDFSSFKSGYVMATLSGVTTPAAGTTWGGIKALYRQ